MVDRVNTEVEHSSLSYGNTRTAAMRCEIMQVKPKFEHLTFRMEELRTQFRDGFAEGSSRPTGQVVPHPAALHADVFLRERT